MQTRFPQQLVGVCTFEIALEVASWKVGDRCWTEGMATVRVYACYFPRFPRFELAMQHHGVTPHTLAARSPTALLSVFVCV